MSAVGVKRIAQRVVRRNLEKKQRTYSLWTAKDINGGGLSLAGTVTSEYGAIIPNVPFLMAVSQGTTSQTRIGNHLNNARATIQGFIRSNPFSSTTNLNQTPFEVVMVIFKKKDDYLYNNPNELKDSKVNTYVAVDGSIQNDMLPWNKDGYTIYKTRRWRMKPQPVAQITAVPDNTSSGFHNEASVHNPETGSSLNPMMVRFKQRLPLLKTIKYDENSPYSVQNQSFALGFYILNCNGDTNASGQYRAQIWTDMTLSWTD